jgi:hypothetical protein
MFYMCSIGSSYKLMALRLSTKHLGPGTFLPHPPRWQTAVSFEVMYKCDSMLYDQMEWSTHIHQLGKIVQRSLNIENGFVILHWATKVGTSHRTVWWVYLLFWTQLLICDVVLVRFSLYYFRFGVLRCQYIDRIVIDHNLSDTSCFLHDASCRCVTPSSAYLLACIPNILRFAFDVTKVCGLA